MQKILTQKINLTNCGQFEKLKRLLGGFLITFKIEKLKKQFQNKKLNLYSQKKTKKSYYAAQISFEYFKNLLLEPFLY